MKWGVLACTNGGVFREIYSALSGRGVDFVVVTDRPCGIEKFCHDHGIAHRRIEFHDRATFSRAAYDFLSKDGPPNITLLFFLRMIGPELFRVVPCFNVHPSLLPAYPGFHAVDRAIAQNIRYLGSTLHLATSQPDAGPIVTQSVMPLAGGESKDAIESFSFVQKTALCLVLYELLLRGELHVDAANGHVQMTTPLPYSERLSPSLRDDTLLKFLRSLESRTGCGRVL